MVLVRFQFLTQTNVRPMEVQKFPPPSADYVAVGKLNMRVALGKRELHFYFIRKHDMLITFG